MAKKWKRGKIEVQLTVREIAELQHLLHSTKGFKRILNKINKESDWYFGYPFSKE